MSPTGSASEVAPRPHTAASGYDLVTMFDCLHDMGDPVGAARQVRRTLGPDGTWMIVEPMAGDRVEDNLNPVGRAFYGFSTLLCTPASLSQEVGLALGAQAGEARIREVVEAGGLHALPARGRDAVQPRLRGAAMSPTVAAIRTRNREPVRRRAAGAGREQSRARYPDAEGFVERDGPRSSMRSTARRADRSPAARPGRWSTRATGRCRSLTSRATSGCSRWTVAATAARTADAAPKRYATDEFAADAWR